MKHETLARMALAAYLPLEPAESLFIDDGWSLKLIERNETQCMVFKGADDLVFAFRGTERKWRDIRADLDLRWKPIDGAGHVYRGFHDAMCQVRDELFALADRAGGRKVSVTGHSLGGAESYLFACFLERSGVRVDQVVTFGAPRPGDRRYRDVYNNWLVHKTYRYMLFTDPVCLVPSNIRGGRHVGGNFAWWTGLRWRYKFQWWRAAIVGTVVRLLLGLGSSHPMKGYVDVLRRHEDEIALNGNGAVLAGGE